MKDKSGKVTIVGSDPTDVSPEKKANLEKAVNVCIQKTVGKRRQGFT